MLKDVYNQIKPLGKESTVIGGLDIFGALVNTALKLNFHLICT